MLTKLRQFSQSKIAIVLVAIIIIPFVFWGMGGVFSSGNKNSITKINNKNISTKDFVDHINFSRIDQNYIKDNINKNILEELLAKLISKTLIKMEIEKFNLSISEEVLAKKIKNNKNFFDGNKKFSRIKYEKFLLENNISAPDFEINLKNNELKKNLFFYINGGIKSPLFLVNKTNIDQNKKIEINYINLNKVYKKNFTEEELNNFIKENENLLKRDFIDFSYVKIDPMNLIQVNDFNNEFFKKIDEIENLILNGENIEKIVATNNLNLTNKN